MKQQFASINFGPFCMFVAILLRTDRKFLDCQVHVVKSSACPV